jgi:perosamine synthetase
MKAIFITVRTGSKRLPNKALLKINRKETIVHLMERMKKSHRADIVVLCTSTNKNDKILCDLAEENGIHYFRGSEDDKLERWRGACKEFNVEFFVTADGDDLFCEPELCDLAFEQYDNNNSEFIQGDGLICGSFTYGVKYTALEKVCQIKDSDDTEMMWVYFTDTGLFDVEYLANVPTEYKRTDIRMTLDYEDDLKFFDNIFTNLKLDFNLKDVVSYIDTNPYVKEINYHLEEKWKENQNKKIEVKLKSFKGKGWRFLNNERRYVNEVLDNGFGASETGAMTERLEALFARTHNQNYAIGFNSGTSTLHSALESFGVGEGDEVMIPALTVAMCGYAVWQCGATPVYVDVRKDTFLMDPEDIKRKITSKTKAIMPVHIYGQVCDMTSIMKIAKEHNLYVLEDCAQCFLGTDGEGRIAGTIGDVGSWSFENSKHLSCGDGGIVTTDNPELAKFIRQFGGVGFKNITAESGKVRIDRDKFQNPNWKRHNIMAYNYRLPEICAAVAFAQLENIDYFVDLRMRMGKGYLRVLEETQTDLLIPQYTPEGYIHSYYTFGCLFNGEKYGIEWQDFRKKYIEYGGDGIYAAWQTVNNEPCFENEGWGDVPVAEELQRNIMQFTTNQKDKIERDFQLNALKKTIDYFGN